MSNFVVQVKVGGRQSFQYLKNDFHLTIKARAGRYSLAGARQAAGELRKIAPAFPWRIVSLAPARYPRCKMTVSFSEKSGGPWDLMGVAVAFLKLVGWSPEEIQDFISEFMARSYDENLEALASLFTVTFVE